jgi:hypothetical protein
MIAGGGFSAPQYWLSRLVFQRALAAVYLVAFLVALNQFRPLLGERGLMPVPRFVARVPFRKAPSLFHLRYSDRFFAAAMWIGIALSAAALLGWSDAGPLWLSMVTWLALWVLYLSVVNVGQTFYAFGWESLLLETGFLAVFLGPKGIAPPTAVLWLLRWVVLRLELGAGLIKLRGDRCWRDLTCLYYHHETQPLPNPLSWFFHHLPRPVHKAEVLGNYLAQLVAPVVLLGPQPAAGAAAVVVIVTQAWLVASGNFSWLNVLTITLASAAVPDSLLAHVLPVSPPEHLRSSPLLHQGVVWALVALVAVLSYRPARNLFARRQLMNYSFDSLHLVNTYGAFGSVTRSRYEIVIEGTDDAVIGPATVWTEYEFKGKPGDPRRRPPQVAPYHLRLDWLMWFAALSRDYADPWFGPFIAKLLENDPAAVALLRRTPFPEQPPAFVRARLYRYRFTTREERRQTGAWWNRTLAGEYLPPMRRQPGRAAPAAASQRWPTARSAKRSAGRGGDR